MDNKVMWIDSDWNVFKEMVLGHSINYLWKNGIDSDVVFVNSNGDREAYLLDQFLVDEFMSLYNEVKDSNELNEFFRNKLMEIRNHQNHFHNSTVVPCQREYNLGDVIYRMKKEDISSFVLRMDLLINDREDLINGVDKNYLSMGLYYYITEILKKKCILFTEESVEEVVNNNWKNIYENNIGNKLSLKRSVNNG